MAIGGIVVGATQGTPKDTEPEPSALAGDESAQRDLAAGWYSTRWTDSSEREKGYLAALVQLTISGDHPIGADVARALGQAPSAVTYLRARLLQKGTICTEGRALRFAVPGMATWIETHRHRRMNGADIGSSDARASLLPLL